MTSSSRCRASVTVYFNPADLALTISDKTKANPDRLGSDGPRMVDLLPKKVVLVDCRNVARHADPTVQHGYFARSRAMAFDIGAVLAGIEAEAIGNRDYILALRAWRLVRELEG
jgi:esterase/lipase superfamily enzyme